MTTKIEPDISEVLNHALARLIEMTEGGRLNWSPLGPGFTPDALVAEIGDVRFIASQSGRISAKANGKSSSIETERVQELLAAIRQRYPQWWEVDEEGWKAAVLNALR